MTQCTLLILSEVLNILKFILDIRKNLLRFFNKHIISRFSKNGKVYDVPDEERQKIPKATNRRKTIVIIFYSVLVLLLFILVASFVGASKAKNESKDALKTVKNIETKYQDNAETVQYNPKLKLFTDKFIDDFMNVSGDEKNSDVREDKLKAYYPTDYKQTEENAENVERHLNHKEFYNITRKDKQTIIQYIVNYDLKVKEEKQVKVKKKKEKGKKQEYETKTETKERTVNQKILINLPIKSENNRYVIVEFPYFTSIPSSKLNHGTMVKDNLEDQKREDNPKVKAFIEDFFNKYSSSKPEDMAYLMDNPQGLEGKREVSKFNDIRLYPKGKGYVAKVDIRMKDKEAPLENTEHYTLEIIKKDKKYYVKKMTNTFGG
ncbi:TPA: conjugal transfer protein [Staphylococcus aureus]|nr:conjugal transfer protein [Staphylococcus aureus]HDJ2799856.1 conjugal transfer protein [Staphylococcus aureus]HDJ2914837.1 conjugal transfer protein [Staphylococcus aureus]HDJ3039297.1 conjugal transfer protein [Staphylococcus aureus]HDJ3144346.1 conjugal transfer protein [Staphylococcus aureus]